ncbi:hypothetical protein IP91_02778 [Pseudoduganella lurida]|uniref:Uncharacterized protein n=1 Tax=Pseudoduganella lurida TaxID=1036180 RepID=A0A562RAD8_9BURK|nr:hypothetical protein [Pseudoduganella lurida]TWI65370.1 hypothetical protein IP91_02778 [Pseudoduganella lurida]
MGATGGSMGMPGWRGTIQSIEPMTRQQAGIGVGGSVGAAAAGGAMPDAGAPSDRVYRVTLRTEDGGMQSVVVDKAPEYKVGDRVMYSNGAFQRQ